jgi:hypothetical protein
VFSRGPVKEDGEEVDGIEDGIEKKAGESGDSYA